MHAEFFYFQIVRKRASCRVNPTKNKAKKRKLKSEGQPTACQRVRLPEQKRSGSAATCQRVLPANKMATPPGLPSLLFVLWLCQSNPCWFSSAYALHSYGGQPGTETKWKCRNMPAGATRKMATPPGLEPELSGPKPLVLPLHNGVAYMYIPYHIFSKFPTVYAVPVQEIFKKCIILCP